MATLSHEMIEEIRGVVDRYAIRERARLKAADDAAWERLRVIDPARYGARENAKFLVKVYFGDLGCIETYTFDTSTESLEFIRLRMAAHGPNSDYDYYYFAPDGGRIDLDLDWIPRVRCK